MKSLKLYVAVIVFTAMAATLTGCKRDDGVKPAKVTATQQKTLATASDSTGISGGQNPPVIQ
jgi:hypothetical protein